MNIGKWLKCTLAVTVGICGIVISDVHGKLNVSAEEYEIDASQLYAQSAVLMDGESGRVLYEKNGEEEKPMASTTKIMTCILALESGNLKDIVTISKEAAAQPEVHLGVNSGDTFYLEDLLYSIMLESHNDSAWAIAEHIAGSVEKFTDLMDQKAREIGCVHTNFVTPNGLDGEDEEGSHHTTAQDLASIMKYCIMESPQKDMFLKITQTKTRQFQDTTGKKQYTCNNHNAFLEMMDEALTGKTGFTGKAGYCYIGAVRKDDRTFIIALLACGWPNNKTYKWSDMKKLAQYGINQYEYCTYWKEAIQNKEIQLLESGKKKTVDNATSENGNVYEDGTVTVFLNLSSDDLEKKILMKQTEKIDIQIQETKHVKAPIEKSEQLGNVTIKLDGMTLDQKPILSGERINKKTLSWFYIQLWNIYAL